MRLYDPRWTPVIRMQQEESFEKETTACPWVLSGGPMVVPPRVMSLWLRGQREEEGT